MRLTSPLNIILLIVTTILAYSMGAHRQQEREPAWECYRETWGHTDRMKALGLEGLSAQEVHAYCVKMALKETPSSAPPADPILEAKHLRFDSITLPTYNLDLDDNGCLDLEHEPGLEGPIADPAVK